MGDERPDHPEDTWIARQRTVAELGKLAIISWGQIGADFTDLLFDEMVVVEQPLGGGGDRPSVIGRVSDAAVGLEQDGFVLPETNGQGPSRGPFGRHRLVRGEAFGMLFQPLNAEQLAANRVFVPNRSNGREPEGAPQQRFQ